MWRLVAAGVLCGMATTLAAQQPIFRSTTQHVAIDAVVTDRNDRVITDLTKDDFEIRENGRLQTISDFAFVSIPLANRAIDLDAPPAPPSDVGANASSLRSSRAIAVLVDDSSLSAVLVCLECPDVLVSLKQALTRFLQTLTADDQVAIVWLGRSDLSQDFTNDIPRLIAAVNNMRGAMGFTQPLGPPWRPRVDSLKSAIAALHNSRYARRAIVYLGARACVPVPTLTQNGRPDFEDVECRDMYEKARNANVPIYALDPRVLPPSGDGTLAELAVNTGGRHFMQQSSPLTAVDQIVTENGSFYTLGFYPEPMIRDGKYHRIEVTVKRPGLRVRARDRYLADTATPPAANAKRDMTAALGSGLDDPSLPIRAFVAPLSTTPRGQTRTLVTVEVTYPVPAGTDTALDDDLRIGILALTPDAKVKASFQRPITFSGTWKPTARGTFVINEMIDLPNDSQLTLRVGISSRALDRTGTARVDVRVPNYRKTDLQLAPIIVGLPGQPLDAVVGLDVWRGLLPFQPSTERRFRATDQVRVFAQAYWGFGATTLAVETRIDDRPPVLTSVPARTPVGGRREAGVDTLVPLGDLLPGPHRLTVTVRAGQQSAERSIPFDIVR